MWDRKSEPPDHLKPEISVTGITFFIDTNIIGDESRATQLLLRCRAEGWIRIQRTDVLGTELTNAPHDRGDLVELADQFAEALTPFVLGDSRLDHAVRGGKEDESRILEAFRLLHPNGNWRQTRRNNRRDAMVLAGVARYGGHHLVTRDKNMLKRANKVIAKMRVSCISPEVAEGIARNAITSVIECKATLVEPVWMPKWVPEPES